MPFLQSTTSLPATWAAGVRTLFSPALLPLILGKGQSCQCQRTEQSRLVAECSFRNDQVIQVVWMEDILFQTFPEGHEQEITCLGYPAAKDHDGRIEDGQVIRHGNAQVVPGPRKGFDRQRVPFRAASATCTALGLGVSLSEDAFPAFICSVTYRAMAGPAAKASMWPRCPHPHMGPSGSTVIWPSFAAMPRKPWRRWPLLMTPPPIPVLTVRYTR